MTRNSWCVFILMFAFLSACASGVSRNDPLDGSASLDVVISADVANIVDAAITCTSAGCDDKLECTNDVCENDVCRHDIVTGFCLIEGVCYADKAAASQSSCHRCLANVSNNSWTADDSLCPASTVSCAAAKCDKGTCGLAVNEGYCLLDGTDCVANNALNPQNECQVCLSANRQTAYSIAADNTPCADDGFSCTQDVCRTGRCVHSLVTGYCVFENACYGPEDCDLSPPVFNSLNIANEAADGYVNNAEKTSTNATYILDATDYHTATYTAFLDSTLNPNCDDSQNYSLSSIPLISDIPKTDGSYVVCVKLTNIGFITYGKSQVVVLDTTPPAVDAGPDVTKNSSISLDATTTGGSTYSWALISQPTVSLGFYWRVSSESCCDFLSFYLDGARQDRISGTSASWAKRTYNITTGASHTLRWCYSKDGSVTTGSDKGWVDNITFTPAWSYPRMTNLGFESGMMGYTSSGNASWSTTSTYFQEGSVSAASGTIGTSSSTCMERTFNFAPPIVTFGSPDAEDTTVSLSEYAVVNLRLTVTDAAGNSASDELIYTYAP